MTIRSKPSSDEYREGHERIFGDPPRKKVPICGAGVEECETLEEALGLEQPKRIGSGE